VTGTERTTDRATSAEIATEIATEQAHVDRVYAELTKAGERAQLVAADGLSRGRTDRTGDVRDEEMTALFERDALVYHAARRRAALDNQYEGLVFGRLDLEHGTDGHHDPEVRYIGRLGVRDDDYEPLVIDWRAPAASPFYRATPVEPMEVVRRRVLRCKGSDVVGVEDDLMVAEPPDGMVVVGDGALLAALTRSRGSRMRDIVATIQRHQDEAVRAEGRGVTEITGGPGTGKTVVALHRAAYLLYSERRRYESGGILVVGPSAAYTAYIERVLPSLGEESVMLRSVGDVVDAVSTDRLDPPEVAAVKGSLRMRRLLARAASDAVPDAPTSLRVFVAGHAVSLGPDELDRVRTLVLRRHARNQATEAARTALADAAWSHVRTGDRDEFLDAFEDSIAVDDFMEAWWPQLDPRDVLLWLADTDRTYGYARGVLNQDEAAAVAVSMRETADAGVWTVSDVALIDDLAARLGPTEEAGQEERGFYEIEDLEDPRFFGVRELGARQGADDVSAAPTYETSPEDARDRLLRGRIDRHAEYAHVLVDEAQDLSPMQWRMVGRRGRHASWTVVGDAAQASWGDPEEARRARDDAFRSQERRHFHMDTNYRNAREVFDFARDVILPHVPDADIPQAVRATGVEPRVEVFADVRAGVRTAVDRLLDEVEGAIAVISPVRHSDRLAELSLPSRVNLIDPMSTKGLEYDATVVVDPDAIADESPGGVRVLYVALTRAAHRMTVLRPA
jgi:hypothetical protein